MIFYRNIVHKVQGAQLVQDILGDAEGFHFDHREVLHHFLQLGRRIHGHDIALVDHRDALAQRIGFEHVVRGEQDGLVLVLQVAHHLAQLAGAHRVEADSRLVEEEHLGVVDQRAGDVQALLHAA